MQITKNEADAFITNYFKKLYIEHDIESLGAFLDAAYWDDDIGVEENDHIKNSKEYLKILFEDNPTIGIDIIEVTVHDNVISAYLTWFVKNEEKLEIIRKGIAIFEMNIMKISKRHTYIYYDKSNESKY